MLFFCVSLHRVSVSCGGVACVLCFSYLWSACVCVCVFFCRNINNGKMMILVVAPVLQASLYLMLHGDWHTLFLIPQQTHKKKSDFCFCFWVKKVCKGGVMIVIHTSLYISQLDDSTTCTTIWSLFALSISIFYCFFFFWFIVQSRMKIFPIITDFTVINTQIITIFRLRLHLLW